MTTKAQTQTMADIEWDVIEGENTEFSAQYPRLQWVHGNKQAAGFMKTGGLFVSKDQYPNFTADGFEATTFITRDGSEIEGYAAASAQLAVIRIKHQWVRDETYGKNIPLAHVLCVVKGCPDLLCISLKGSSKALDLQKAFNAHIAQNVAFANRIKPVDKPCIEPLGLWFPLVSGEQISITSKDGKSSSAVTLPTLSTPQTLDRDYVVSLWVGAKNYASFTAYYRQTERWKNQPIWEQRTGGDDNHDTPTHSGDNGDRISDSQADLIGGLVETKGLEVDEIKQMCLTVSSGATSTLASLNRDEGSALIELLKAY